MTGLEGAFITLEIVQACMLGLIILKALAEK